MNTPFIEEPHRRFRHKERGTVYLMIGYGKAQCSPSGLLDNENVVLYIGEEDGQLWARRHAEFMDGRFEEIEPAPTLSEERVHELWSVLDHTIVVSDGTPHAEAMRDVAFLIGHPGFPKGQKEPSKAPLPMRELLKRMFTGFMLHEASWDRGAGEYTRTEDDCFTEACGGNAIEGGLLSLFTYWSNDIQSLAPHYGISLERHEAPDEETNGELYIREDIPPAPSPAHWWTDGEWKAPPEDEPNEEAVKS